MRLGYFAMPVHPLHRTPTETLKEDREAVILADDLGYYDAFIGEHLTDKAENITNSMIFLATLIHSTKQIKLATGTTNLSHSHPALIAAHAAMMDHLSEGRFIFGVSPGALASDAEALGILDQDRNDMFGQAIEVILKIWEQDPPYDIETERWTVSTAQTIFPEIGLPNPLEEPGKPDIRQSNRALGTGARIAVPVLNIHRKGSFRRVLWMFRTGIATRTSGHRASHDCATTTTEGTMPMAQSAGRGSHSKTRWPRQTATANAKTNGVTCVGAPSRRHGCHRAWA